MVPAAMVSLGSGISFAGINGPSPAASLVPGASAPGKPATVSLGASVLADGSLVRGFGSTGASRISTGKYQVNFDRNIASCIWSGSVGFGAFSGSPAPGSIAVTGRAGTVRSVLVETWSATGAPLDQPFSVFVLCG